MNRRGFLGALARAATATALAPLAGIEKAFSPNHPVVKPVTIALGRGALLRKDEWIYMDKAVIAAARPLLKKWNDLARSGHEDQLLYSGDTSDLGCE